MLLVHTNLTDTPDGIEYYNVSIQCFRPTDKWNPPSYYTPKLQIDSWLKHNGLPLCDDVDPLAEQKADLVAKEQKANNLKPVADAAAFAIEQTKSDGAGDEVSQELRIHWSAQEHAYLVAQSEVETAKKALHLCSLS